ncbi:MAG: hypothetical protein J1F20_03580 [Muribaculaceae bacterium]|nr:hypothetical protein [Muribaculaceae bacterium]
MKKIAFIFLGLILTSIPLINAQETEISKINSKYINIAFSASSMKQAGNKSVKSKGGASITVGNTYFIKPVSVGNLLRFGIDASWIDFNYDYYNVQYHNTSMVYDQIEAAVQFGPSLTLTPTDLVRSSVYFRYAPTLSLLLGNDNTEVAYGSYFVGGINASYKFLGIGVESRFGTSKYLPLTLVGTIIESDRIKTKLNGFRIYLTINF